MKLNLTKKQKLCIRQFFGRVGITVAGIAVFIPIYFGALLAFNGGDLICIEWWLACVTVLLALMVESIVCAIGYGLFCLGRWIVNGDV